ncbi:unnamed protein product [Heterobilharzia americana]|nr:unnamed protein product [Heterobilharzia americana]
MTRFSLSKSNLDWTVHFNGWVPLSCKRNFIHSLCSRIYKICSEDTVDVEIETLRTILSNKGYPKGIIDKNLKKRTTPHPIRVPKKILTVKLEFKGDTTAGALKNRLSRSINSDFYAARLRLIFSSRRLSEG